jgi:hypothetical protein
VWDPPPAPEPPSFGAPSSPAAGSAAYQPTTDLSGARPPISGSDEPPTSTFGAIGAKLTAAGAAAVAAATSAKEAVKSSVTSDTSGPSAGIGAVSSVQTPPGVGSPGAAAGTSGIGSASGTGAAGVAAVSAASRAAGRGRTASRAARSPNRQPRKARLTLSHINVYSVFKFSCVLSIALFFVWLIMVGVLYGLLDVSGVLTQVNDAVRTISGTANAKDAVTGSLVFGVAIIIGAVNIILFIAISTIGSMVYNLCADLVGGAEVTLSERE